MNLLPLINGNMLCGLDRVATTDPVQVLWPGVLPLDWRATATRLGPDPEAAVVRRTRAPEAKP